MCDCNEPKALVPEGAPCECRKMDKAAYMLEVIKAYLGGKKIEFRDKTGTNQNWKHIPNPVWNWETCEYRVKVIEGLPVIDWSNVPKDYNYFAVDHDGQQYFYQTCPRTIAARWIDGGRHASVYGIPYSCHWAESLVKRPD
jgi:hypothetical protein